MSVLVGTLVAVGVLLAAGPGPRPGVQRRARASGVRRWGPVPGAATDAPALGRGAHGRAAPHAGRDLAGVVLGVAAQVRAGAPPVVAWGRELGRRWTVLDPDALEAALRTRTACGAGRRHAALRARVHGVVVGTQVAVETGAPLADVLEDLAAAVEADAEQAGELEAALAGPRATARVLTGLPLLGALVGAGVGARPWEVLADGGPGTGAGVLGAGLVVAGRLWVGALLRRAAGPGP